MNMIFENKTKNWLISTFLIIILLLLMFISTGATKQAKKPKITQITRFIHNKTDQEAIKKEFNKESLYSYFLQTPDGKQKIIFIFTDGTQEIIEDTKLLKIKVNPVKYLIDEYLDYLQDFLKDDGQMEFERGQDLIEQNQE